MEASHPHIHLHSTVRVPAQVASWHVQLQWFALALVVGFLVPFVGSSTLSLHHDVYLGVYFVVVLALFAGYARRTQLDLMEAIRRHWIPGVALGVVVGAALVANVLAETHTARPSGFYFVFELVWRGGIYGAVDALLLTVLPCLIAYRALGERLPTWRKRIAYFAASLAMVLTITAAYHLGYSQYRDAGVGAPEKGNALISIPMLLTVNPIGSVADHAAMHIAAVAHTYETDVRLPPAAKAK